MSDRISDALLRILEAIEEKKGTLDPTQLALFRARKGELSTGELMVVGRAVNGGGKGWSPDELSSPDKRESIIRDAKAESRGKRHNASDKETENCKDEEAPMRWVTDLWGARNLNRGGAKYNTARSPFWRVIKKVTHELEISTDEVSWPAHIIWSNLYKVSPRERGNPSKKLISAQHESCTDVLRTEIETWRPKRILMMTGLDWASGFLKHLGEDVKASGKDGLVQFVGTLPFESSSACRIVVTKRPERNPEEAITQEIVMAFTDKLH